ncbi:MAG: hypothetical protein ACE5I7_20430 [Candidatus Binatia bacterium]
MATDKGKGKGRDKGRDKGGDKGGGEPQGPGKHHGGDPVKIHEEYVRHHVEGGAPATSEAYERAREQFRRLPGAVQTPPTDVKQEPPKPRPDDDESDEQKP